MITVQNVAKQFIRPSSKKNWYSRSKKEVVQAVKNISFKAQDGKITGLLGANGAGKTTTLRMIASLLKPDSGQIWWTILWCKQGNNKLCRTWAFYRMQGVYIHG